MPLNDQEMDIEISVVLPCLNEADTLEVCLRKAQQALTENHIRGEIIVADNGSTDSSIEIAERLGARIVRVDARGYGVALMGGITAARGRYVLMGDADNSYDFLEIPKFIRKLREGYDLVQGCRLPAGGGHIAADAMPFSHRWIGNPLLSGIARSWFQIPIHDVYCGMRAFTKTLYNQLDLRCTGMEFATEMIIKASLLHVRISEIPITLYPDGRLSHRSHLRTVRDGWRTLRFFLMYSPRWLFFIPGFLLITAGLTGYGLALPGLQVHQIVFDAHTLLFSTLAILVGYQAVLFAFFVKIFAARERLIPEDPRIERLCRIISLEKGLLIGSTALLVGGALLLWAVNLWRLTDFGRLDYAHTMRWVIPGAMLVALGFQTVLSSFFVSILRLRRT